MGVSSLAVQQINKSLEELNTALEDETKERTDEMVTLTNRIATEENVRNSQVTNLTNLIGSNSIAISKHTTSIKSATRKIKDIMQGRVVFDGLRLKDDAGGIWILYVNREKKSLDILREDEIEDTEKKPDA